MTGSHTRGTAWSNTGKAGEIYHHNHTQRTRASVVIGRHIGNVDMVKHDHRVWFIQVAVCVYTRGRVHVHTHTCMCECMMCIQQKACVGTGERKMTMM